MTQPSPAAAPACVDCLYYHEHSYGSGDCHRYPPSFVGGDAANDRHHWKHPLVPQHDWCGEFRRRPAS